MDYSRAYIMKKLIVLLMLVYSLFSDTTTNMSTSVNCEQILQMDNKKLIVKSGCVQGLVD
jgi:hypothetical protein